MNQRFTILGRSFGYSFALSSFESASNTRNCVVVTLLFTENCTEETRKSKQGRYCELMYTIFSTLKDFPKQIRIKRKYLEVVRR